MDPREKAAAAAIADEAGFGMYRKTAVTKARQMAEPFKVETAYGTQEGAAGDYLCFDASHLPYPCPKAVFEATYERVS